MNKKIERQKSIGDIMTDIEKKIIGNEKHVWLTGKEIADAVNEIIKTLDRYSEEVTHQAVNWASVRCTQVQECTELYPDEGEKSIVVYIDECSPDAWKFKEAVYNVFKEKYGFDIDIICGW